MNTKHLIETELAQALEGVPPFNPTAESLPALRTTVAQIQAIAPPAPGVTVGERLLPRPDGTSLRVLIYRPDAPSYTGGLLWFHGGGMIMTTPDGYDAQSRFFAHRMGCMVVAVDFRLAPEHPYPAGLEDGYQALQWLHESADELRIPGGRIAVTGESGSGCIAAALSLYARDHCEATISAQFLQYPMLDDRTGTATEPNPLPNAGEFVWTKASNQFAWGAVLGREPGGPDTPDYAAPGRVENLAGMPPTHLFIGELDLFAGENPRFAQNLLRHGVSVELHVYAGAYHAFMSFAPDAKITQRAQEDFWGAMERHFRGIN